MIILLSFVFLAASGCAVLALLRPSTFHKLLRTPSRWKQTGIFLAISLCCLVLVGIFAPPVENPVEMAPAAIDEAQNVSTADVSQPTDVIDATATPGATAANQEAYTVTNVVDGDTVDVSIAGETKRLRLIGVDTPETKDPRKPVQCFGKEASAFTTATLLNQAVTLESDATQGDVDKYGRLLRYVVLLDGTNFNKRLISEGYAHEYTYDAAYKYQTEFKVAQTDAATNKRGLWADNTCAGDTSSSDASTQTDTPESTTEQPATSAPATDSTSSSSTTVETAPEPATSAVCDCSRDNYKCADFSTHTAAQACFNYCMEQVGSDIHRLDGNNDGSACE